MVCSRTISTPTGRVRSLERKIDNEIHNKIALLWKLACLQLVRNVGDCGRLLFRKLSFFPPFYLLRGGRVDQGDPPNPVNCLDWIEQQGHVIWASIQKADAVGALHEFCFISLFLSLSFSFGTLYDDLQSETVIIKKNGHTGYYNKGSCCIWLYLFQEFLCRLALSFTQHRSIVPSLWCRTSASYL